jgi:hypothetical protein
VEGPEAQEDFERGMKVLFKVPKGEIVQRKIYFCGGVNFSGHSALKYNSPD